jgi:hypothetical protein
MGWAFERNASAFGHNASAFGHNASAFGHNASAFGKFERVYTDIYISDNTRNTPIESSNDAYNNTRIESCDTYYRSKDTYYSSSDTY